MMRTNTVSGLPMLSHVPPRYCPMADCRLCSWGDEYRQHVVLGLTLDYGPFGFLDDYEPGLFVITRIIKGVTALIINLPSVVEFTASGADIVTICCRRCLNEALDSYQQVLLTHYGQRMGRNWAS